MTTKIRVMSDLHLDFHNYDYVPEDEDILVLAGDVAEGIRGISWIARKIPPTLPVIYVLGNHEFYNHSMKTLKEKIQKIIDNECSNVHLLDNESFIFNNIKFIGSTLWTDYNLFKNSEYCMRIANIQMNDFACIKKSETNRLTPRDCKLLFNKAKSFISQELKSSSMKNVIVTHHGPSNKSSSIKFRDGFLTAAFVSNLESFIMKNNIELWIHGHCHSRSKYMIGDCKIVCNPLGYPNEIVKYYSPVIIEV